MEATCERQTECQLNKFVAALQVRTCVLGAVVQMTVVGDTATTEPGTQA